MPAIPAQRRRIVETEVCWTFPNGLEDEARKRCRNVRRNWPDAPPFADLLHEALIWAATHPATLKAHLADPAKGLAYSGFAIEAMLNKLAGKNHKRRLAEDRWGHEQGFGIY